MSLFVSFSVWLGSVLDYHCRHWDVCGLSTAMSMNYKRMSLRHLDDELTVRHGCEGFIACCYVVCHEMQITRQCAAVSVGTCPYNCQEPPTLPMFVGIILLVLVNLCKGRGPSLQVPLTFVPPHMQRGPVAAPITQMLVFKPYSSKISLSLVFSQHKSVHSWARLHSQSVQEQFRFLCSSTSDETVISRTCKRDQPMDWEELHETIVLKKDLASLFRSQQVEDRYTQHRLQVSQTYDSIYDYILHAKFNLPREWNRETSRWRVPYKSTTGTPIALAPNDFPYFTAPGVEHWVLWKLGRAITDDDIAQAMQTLRDDHNVAATIHWENPPHLKSLPSIDHYHILAKTRDT